MIYIFQLFNYMSVNVKITSAADFATEGELIHIYEEEKINV